MSLSVYQLNNSILLYEAGTTGGGTYYVNGEPTCLWHLYGENRDRYCANGAGLKTSHPDTGRCKYHGGMAGRGMLHGRYANVTKGVLRQQYDAYVEDPQMLDLVPELVMTRTLLGQAMELYQDDPKDSELLKLNLQCLNQITRTVESIERIASNHTLTVATTRLVMLRAMDVARHFLVPGREVEVGDLSDFISLWEKDVVGMLGSGSSAEVR